MTLRTVNAYRHSRELLFVQLAAKRENPAGVLIVKRVGGPHRVGKRWLYTGMGTGDHSDLYRGGDGIYHMIRCPRLGYCGLEFWNWDTLAEQPKESIRFYANEDHVKISRPIDPDREVFFQNAAEEIDENWDQWGDRKLLNFLIEYLAS